MGLIKKSILNGEILLHSLFRGMKSADAIMTAPTHNGSSDDILIQQQVSQGGVLNDLLQKKETQAVKELRDAYYRLMYESDKFKVNMVFNEKGDLMEAKAIRSEDGRWNKHAKVYEEDGLPIRLIQDNTQIEKKSVFATDVNEEQKNYKPGSQIDYDVLLTVTYDGFSPRFRIDKYVTRIVVKENIEDKSKGIFELYLSEYQEQFNKIHAIIIKNLFDLSDGKLRNPDFIDFKTISFITDGKAWNCSPAMEFAMEDIEYMGCKRWDGHFILTFKGNYTKNCVSVGERFRTKELDEKYAKKALKHEGTIDLFTAERHIKEGKLENKED